MPAERGSTGLEALLARYVLGEVPAPVDAILRAHLELSPENRDFVRDLAAMAGLALHETAPVALPRRSEVLQAVLGSAGETRGPAAEAKSPGASSDPIYPPALVAYLGPALERLPWRTRLPGLREYRVPNTGTVEASLYWIRPGRAIPRHTHSGTELTLVLKGAFHDVTGRYRRGDLSLTDDSIDHRPTAEPDGDCICFAVVDAPRRLTGLIGRRLGPLIGA